MPPQQLENYASTVDGKPAHISVDCLLARRAPILGLPFLAWICLDLAKPGPDGLLHKNEKQGAANLEQALVKVVHDGKTGVYCGNCTTGGQRDYLFYLAEASNWEQRVNRVLAAFPKYRFRCFSHMETRWDTSFHFLYPEDGEMPSLQAHALRAGLRRRKASMHSPRLLTHSLSFCSAADRERFCHQAREEGFMTEMENVAPSPDNLQYIRARRRDLPGTAEQVIVELKELAAAHGGNYESLETAEVHMP